jgi:di/tricarboxylate transporter
LVEEGLVLPRHDPAKALLSGALLLGAIAAVSTGFLEFSTGMLGAAGLALAFGCLPVKEVGAYVNFRFLIMLAAMAAMGTAMETSGAAAFLAAKMIALTGSNPHWVLGGLFALTVALTQPLSNAAAALLVLPLAVHAATGLALDPRPFAVTICLAASCSFLTPFEPACLLVYATGHYRFVDFVKVGAVLTAIAGGICLLLVPLLWPLAG